MSLLAGSLSRLQATAFGIVARLNHGVMHALAQREQLSRELHDGIGGITSHIAMLAYRGSGEVSASRQQEHFRNIEYLVTEWNRELRLWMNGKSMPGKSKPRETRPIRRRAAGFAGQVPVFSGCCSGPKWRGDRGTVTHVEPR